MLYAGPVWALAQGMVQAGPSVAASAWVTRCLLVAAVIGSPCWIAFVWLERARQAQGNGMAATYKDPILVRALTNDPRLYDWTAAAIELLIVVVGILIALQVSNGNESRLDHTRADSYCRQL